MDRPQCAVFFMEDATESPLMLEAIAGRPILSRMGGHLMAEGVRRFFVVCDPRFAPAVRACFPPEAEVVTSDLQKDLTAFLNTPDPVLVLNRSAVPMAGAGPGFAYAAPGYELQEAWREKMTNAVQAAELVAGWVPLFGPETVAELEPLLLAQDDGSIS